MKYRETQDDAEASEFASDLRLREAMEKEGFMGEVLHRGKGQIVFRRVAFTDDKMGLCIGMVCLFRGFTNPKENGWSASIASEIKSDEEMAEARATFDKMQTKVLEGTKRLSPEDIF